jgi:FlaA1/EpsC-like NDP-sugar epimerase
MLDLIGRQSPLFETDIDRLIGLSDKIRGARFLVIGGAGSIGQAVVREIFLRDPKLLHVVDISENNMVELVRDLRSTLGYGSGDFKTFAVDCGGREFEALMAAEGPYDFVFNLSALKHVRSEKDPYTLMRMVNVNILNTLKTLELAGRHGTSKYFCVSTDKAANPVNMMGASKRIMEMFLVRQGQTQTVSMARFANVAFSDGSLLHGFNQRLAKQQPISAPNDVRRYFMTPQESGQLCLLSGLMGEHRDIFFPKLSDKLNLVTFSDVAVAYLRSRGYDPYVCQSEDEARARADELIAQRQWPCYFFKSDTTGEKDFEEFFTAGESLDMDRFDSIGVIRNDAYVDPDGKLDVFLRDVHAMLSRGAWNRQELVTLFTNTVPDFQHLETGKHLDQKM